MKVVTAVIFTVGIIYVSFGMFCVYCWGNGITAIVLDELDTAAPKELNYTIVILFCLNLFFSFPLVLYPAHIIIENYLYYNWEKTKKR